MFIHTFCLYMGGVERVNFSVFTNMSLLASINFGIYLVLSPSHTYSTFRLASIYFGKMISCVKFTKINGKPIFQALQYTLYTIA